MSFFRVIVSLIAVLGLCLYAHFHPPVQTLEYVLQHQQQYTGKRLEFYVETIADSMASDGFELRQGRATIWVQGRPPDLESRDFVTVDGVLQPDGSLTLGCIYVAKRRRWKMAVSVIALVWIAFDLKRNLRLGAGGVEVRNNA